MTVAQAQALLQEGKTPQALALASSLLKDNPQLVGAHLISAMAQTKLGALKKAVEHLDHCLAQIDQAANPVMARVNMAAQYFAAQAYEKADEVALDAAEMAAADVTVLQKIADLLDRYERWPPACDVYCRALELEPRSPRFLSQAGIAAHKSGDLEKAVSLYRQSLEITGDQPSVCHNMIMALMNLGRPAEAVPYADAWLQQHPGNIEAMSFKALLSHEAEAHSGKSFWLDFDRFVRTRGIEAPQGYENIGAFNRALESHVLAFPDLKTPPRDDPRWHHPALKIGQGLITEPDRPDMMRIFEQTMRIEVDKYMAEMAASTKPHPFIAHMPKEYDLYAWAAVLEGEGNQDQHIHIDGYLSGCYYVTIPDEIASEENGRDGAFVGGFRIGPPPAELAVQTKVPEHQVKPEEGRLVLFPAYMYHGTIPFNSTQRRICIAFDVMPKGTRPAAH